MFELIVGNEPIKTYFERAIRENRLPQTMLFSGIDGIGKSLVAKAIAEYLLKTSLHRIETGNHPDFHLVSPEGKSGLYAIDTIRAVIDKEHAAPFEAPHKVFILENAERMQPASANALLKTLEEPSQDSTFILLSNAPQEILPTILSRCVHLAFQPLPEEAIASLLTKKEHPAHFAKWAHGSAGRAFELAVNPELEQQRKILFQILSKKGSYLETAPLIDQLETLIEEKKEEDPVRASRLAEHLFAQILMWGRDQALRKIDASLNLLFFPEEPISSYVIHFQSLEKTVDEARIAYQRNIKLSVCLEKILA